MIIKSKFSFLKVIFLFAIFSLINIEPIYSQWEDDWGDDGNYSCTNCFDTGCILCDGDTYWFCSVCGTEGCDSSQHCDYCGDTGCSGPSCSCGDCSCDGSCDVTYNCYDCNDAGCPSCDPCMNASCSSCCDVGCSVCQPDDNGGDSGGDDDSGDESGTQRIPFDVFDQLERSDKFRHKVKEIMITAHQYNQLSAQEKAKFSAYTSSTTNTTLYRSVVISQELYDSIQNDDETPADVQMDFAVLELWITNNFNNLDTDQDGKLEIEPDDWDDYWDMCVDDIVEDYLNNQKGIEFRNNLASSLKQDINDLVSDICKKPEILKALEIIEDGSIAIEIDFIKPPLIHPLTIACVDFASVFDFSWEDPETGDQEITEIWVKSSNLDINKTQFDGLTELEKKITLCEEIMHCCQLVLLQDYCTENEIPFLKFSHYGYFDMEFEAKLITYHLFKEEGAEGDFEKTMEAASILDGGTIEKFQLSYFEFKTEIEMFQLSEALLREIAGVKQPSAYELVPASSDDAFKHPFFLLINEIFNIEINN